MIEKIERIESLKAGFFAGITFIIVDLIFRIFNQKILAIKFNHLAHVLTAIDDQLWWKIIIISGFSGFLFGVTYRYIIRTDQNSHLKDGAVLAFGLTRGLVLLEGLNQLYLPDLIPYLILIMESLCCFLIPRLILDLGIFYQWLSPFALDDQLNN